MFERGYFAHLTPEGEDPRPDAGSASAFILPVKILPSHKRLLLPTRFDEFQGHRENILRTGFGRVGIGILDGGVYRIMISQSLKSLKDIFLYATDYTEALSNFCSGLMVA
jgi:hypothetical protein